MIKLRPEVRHFAELMEMKLRENDYKGKRGWRRDGVQALLSRLCEEAGELVESFSASKYDQPFRAIIIAGHELAVAASVLKNYTPTLTSNFKGIARTKSSVSEAVDVANFAMMVVDVLEDLRGTEAEARKD
jgi:hypothetical protein